MFLDIILIIIIIITISIIISVIFKKLPQINQTNPEETTQYKENKIKKEIIEKKLKKDLDSFIDKFLIVIKPSMLKTCNYVKKTYIYIYNLEERYRKKLIKAHFEDKISLESKIKKHLEVAQEFIQNKEFNKAENEYIDALKLDIHNLEIYKNLANLYFDNKEYDKAKETFEYIIKLKEDDYIYNKLGDISTNKGDLNQAKINYQKSIELKNDNPIYYYNLSKINLKLNQLEDALENIKKALNIESENPKLLDFLLDLSIIMGDKDLANKTLNKLIAVNPDNKKIPEVREKINQI